MTAHLEKLPRTSTIALAFATIWSVALFGLALLPAYSSESMTEAGQVTRTSRTLIEENGAGVLVALAVPLVVTFFVTIALALRSRRGALGAAWTFTGLLAVGNFLALLTIGIFVVPATIALVVACGVATAQRAERAAAPPVATIP